MSVDVVTAERKRVAEPILTHLQERCPDAGEAIMVLMMCVTELVARSLQTTDGSIIGERINQISAMWTSGFENEAPPAPPVLQ